MKTRRKETQSRSDCEITIVPCLLFQTAGVNQTTRREQLQWLCSATVDPRGSQSYGVNFGHSLRPIATQAALIPEVSSSKKT